MEQLIKITTVPIEYELKINNAKIQRRNGSAELEISKTKGGMTIKSRPLKLSIDTFEMRNSISPSPARSVAELPNKGQIASYEASAQFANEGKILLNAKLDEKIEAFRTISQQHTQNPSGMGNVDFIPKGNVEFETTKPEVEIEYVMDKLNFDAKIDNGNIEFIPGSIELNIIQQGDIIIEYVGEPIYVPPSAAEFFGGEVIDVEV